MTSLLMALENGEGSLDKEITSYDDLSDALGTFEFSSTILTSYPIDQ
jgi:hypothetical protein